MKRFITLLMSVIMLVTLAVPTIGAETTVNPAIRISDNSGDTGYANVSDELSKVIAENGGATVIMDVLVESYATPAKGYSSQIAAFSGTEKYNILSYDFASKKFMAGTTTDWIADGYCDYTFIQTNPFDWKTGVWYELAFRFNGNKAAMYLNGICVISTEFNTAADGSITVYPQFCTARFDNIRICAKDYNVTENTGNVIATEDFTGITDASESEVWVADNHEMTNAGCTGVDMSGAGNPGDADGDGEANVSDISLLRRYLSGGSVILMSGADIDYDGEVSVTDLSSLTRMITGAQLNSQFPGMNITPITPDNSASEDAAKPDGPTIMVSNVTASAGQSVEVPVVVMNNPGVAGAKITVSYDSALTLSTATSGEAFSYLQYTKPGKYVSPCNFTWDSEIGMATEDGVILTLTFDIPANAVSGDTYTINCTSKVGHIYDEDLNDVIFDIISGVITVR